ncbi:hypothetical protein FFE93_002830 [Yersinia sp. KBS0713]|nr:hypothetical protein FFE93_002830 [Yersinia sp. KBS0713]QKJ08956.1 hypothetical protein HRK25_03540 [Yersinia bercovieri ATCC 43970]
MTDEREILLNDVMNKIKIDIESIVNQYTGEDPRIELILDNECAAFQFLLENEIEVKVTLSRTLSILLQPQKQ